MLMMNDQSFLARAFTLARRGIYTTDPNPRVGCVIARDGEILGEGFHQSAGDDHAEVIAIENASGDVRGATLYVTLEPCSYFGRTPACAKTLVEKGIKRVVSADYDPHPLNAGQGYAVLEAAGIEVVRQADPESALQLNPGHYKTHQQGYPFVRLKMACTLDGRTALTDGSSQWITSPSARLDVQRLRARSSCIVTGVETILKDDPALTVRELDTDAARSALAIDRKRPIYILDSQLRTPLSAKVLAHPDAKIVCGPDLNQGHARVISANLGQDGRICLKSFLKELSAEGALEVLFECGPTLGGALIESGLCDEMIIYMAPKLMGSGRPLLQLPEIANMDALHAFEFDDIRSIGPDLRLVMKPAS
jgi:diaminohydroxyphosphoribosylaminopyrimidine deaminase / 5-amino-6-(5-phosphoribosylamino)uracil reductase